MKQEIANTEKDIASLVFYLNGGLNYTDAYALTHDQMTTLSKVVSDHFEKQNEALKGNKRQ
jgi:hypothetical protein